MNHLGCKKSIVGVVVLAGYSFNFDGTCIYFTMATIFLAQALNINLSFSQEIGIILVLLLTSKGAAGVKVSGFITLAATLSISNSISLTALTLILGIDRFMSEARAINNLIGNCVLTIAMSKWEKAIDIKKSATGFKIMVFSSNIFLFLFLPLVLIAYFFSPKNFRNYLLLIASLFFYAWGEMQYIFVLIISIIANYFFGIGIDSRKSLVISRKTVLSFAIAFNLVLLGYFKYANFLVNNLNDVLAVFSSLKITIEKVHLPIGISFFTFHSISYIIDIYRGKVRPQKNIFDLALYISLFPQLVAGPIVRYNTINKQLDVKKRRHHPFFVAYGIRRFIIGLAKKVIIANPLGEIADHIFALPADQLSFSIAWIGIVCYSLQIFFDFSGYSDMAIGIARIFGFKFLENFNYPYISKSIKEFWRRWHISLSSWFRDYLYIPLGGNRCSLHRQYFNLVLVFFLCGFWHGASWNFIIWGLFHGVFLVLERTKFGDFIESRKIISHFYTLLIVMIGWVFFRSPDLPYSIAYLNAMFINFNFTNQMPSNISILIFSHFNLIVFAVAILISMPVFVGCRRFLFSNLRDFYLIAILILTIVRLAAGTHNPFIYFQF